MEERTSDGSGTRGDLAPKAGDGGGRRGGAPRVVGVLIRVGLAVVILAVGMGIFMGLKAMKPSAKEKAVAADGAAVRYAVVRSVPVTRGWRGYGTASALRSSQVAAEVPGRVSERLTGTEPGLRVVEGQVLVRLDASEYEDQLASIASRAAGVRSQLAAVDVDIESLDEQIRLSEEGVELAESELASLERAVAGGAGTGIELDRLQRTVNSLKRELQTLEQQRDLIPSRRSSLEAQLEGLEAESRIAQLNIDRATVRAPFDGVLQSVSAQVGERLMVGSPVARVVDLSTIEIPVRVGASAARSLRVGGRATVWRTGRRSEARSATIVRIAPEADPRTRTITAFVLLEQDPDGVDPVRPGEFLNGELLAAETADAPIVPRRAVNDDAVYLLGEDGALGYRRVGVAYYIEGRYPGIDPIETEWAVLDAGLSPGERVVLENHDQLRVGMVIPGQDVAKVTEGVESDGVLP